MLALLLHVLHTDEPLMLLI